MRIILVLLALVLLVSCSFSTTPQVRLANNAGVTMELNQSAKLPTSVEVSPDGRYGLSAGTDKTIRLWDLLQGSQAMLYSGHTGMLAQARFSPDGKYIVSAGFDPSVRLWDTFSGRQLKEFVGHKSMPLVGFSVYAAAVSPDGGKVISSGFDGFMRLWDLGSAKEIRNWHVTAPSLMFSRDGKYVLAGCGKDARLFDLNSEEPVKSFKRGSWKADWFLDVDISPDGKYVLANSPLYGKSICLWDFESGEKVKEIKAEESEWDGFASARFSPDGRYIISGSRRLYIRVFEVPTGRETRQFPGPSAGNYWGSNKVVPTPDSRHVLSAGRDAAVRLADFESGRELAMMVGFEDGEWLVITNDGYYNSSPKGAQYLTVKADEKSYTVDQFYDVFYRPDIVAATLKGENIRDLVTITMQDAIKAPPPTVEFTAVPANTDSVKARVCYQAANAGGGIGEVRLFHNGKLIESDGYYREVARSQSEKQELALLNSKAIYDNMRSVTLKGTAEAAVSASRAKGDVFKECREIETVSGENEVSVTAFNAPNTVQGYMKTVSFQSKRQAEPPHLYILSVGIDRYADSRVNLHYAVKDATDIEKKLLSQSATVYDPQNIHYELLADAKAGKKAIIEKIDELSQKIRPSDGFVLFVAGHGVLLQNQYYMLTHDYNGSVSEASMISSNELVEMSKKIKSLSQLLIFDTCHAGGVDTIVSGLYDARMSVLAKKMGLHIYASASSAQEAQDGYKGNGLFTYTLLDGLSNRREADRNNDRLVSLAELGEYAKTRTADISRQAGHSQTPLIISFGKDNPVYRLR